MTDVASRELRPSTRSLLNRVDAGELSRSPSTVAHQADAALTDDLAELAASSRARSADLLEALRDELA